jgi:hypothetical protein
MPDITIVKLKIRRGTDAQRKTVVLEQGELGYATDTQRVFIGNGVLLGGNPIGSVIHPPLPVANTRTNQANATIGDLVYDNSVLWQLTGSSFSNTNSWAALNTKGDETTITTNASNKLTIKDNSISPSKLAGSIVSPTGGLSYNTSGLSANVDNTYVTIASNRITINSLDENKINSTALSQGLKGGSGTKLSVDADPSQFGFITNVLSITALPLGTVNVNTLSSSFVGTGLTIEGNTIATSVQTYDTNTFNIDVKTLRLKPIIAGGTTSFSNVSYNSFGQISAVSSGISDTLSGSNTGALSAFNGRWNQSTFSNQTLLTAISTNSGGSTARTTLTSAGFMSIQTALGLFAVPIFKYT